MTTNTHAWDVKTGCRITTQWLMSCEHMTLTVSETEWTVSVSYAYMSDLFSIDDEKMTLLHQTST